MQPLTQLSNTQRAKLLFDLFPQEIPAFISFQIAVTENLLRDPDQLTTGWQNPFLPPDFWIRVAGDVHKTLHKYQQQLGKRGSLFADQLFDGNRALYSAHCLQQYALHQSPDDPHFKVAVNLLFA